MNIWNKKSIPHVHNRINYFLNSEMILYQDFNLTWGRKFPSWTASLIQGRYMFSKNVQGWKPENVKISPQKTNTSPPTATMFLSKFFPYPAPLHRPQADDVETGPYHDQNKRTLGWRRQFVSKALSGLDAASTCFLLHVTLSALRN